MKRLPIKALAALWVCKLTKLILRLLGRGGTTLPGQLALRICPTLLKMLAQDIDVTVVSGTNGKTTTCRIIETACDQYKKGCLSNRSGANLLPGITTVFASNANLFGIPGKRCAVIECDELTAEKAFPMLQPKVIVLTNLFRDQLDRCGEITRVQNTLCSAIEKTQDAVLCLNADDPLLCHMAEKLSNKVKWFGLEELCVEEQQAGQSDARNCPRCGSAYRYEYRTFAHLGAWYCPKCGARHPKPDVSSVLLSTGEEYSSIAIRNKGKCFQVTLSLPGVYNLYNAAAAAAALSCAGFPDEEIARALENSRAAFGRGESFQIGAGVKMMLIKNPAGCDRVLNYLSSIQRPFNLIILLNDKEADGTDISWIWDSDFESLKDRENLALITVSGKRAEELSVRLKYAGVDADGVKLTHDYSAIVHSICTSDSFTVIMPTYTAMMELRPLLAKAAGGKDFWEQ